MRRRYYSGRVASSALGGAVVTVGPLCYLSLRLPYRDSEKSPIPPLCLRPSLTLSHRRFIECQSKNIGVAWALESSFPLPSDQSKSYFYNSSAMSKTFPQVQPGGSLILAWRVKDKNVLVVGGGEVGLCVF
jgi:hypothetical protein